MNLKNQPKENAYVRLILPRTLFPKAQQEIEIDSTFCKVHHVGTRKKYGNQAIGVSRSGKTVLGDKAFCLSRIREFIQDRRIATRHDKLAFCFLNFVILSALLIQL